MEVLNLINIALEDFKVFEDIKVETFNSSETCTICFNNINTYLVNNLVFQDKNLQEIFINTTQSINLKEVWEKSEQKASCCNVCLQQLLTSHLFQQKVQKAYEVLKTIVNFKIKTKSSVKDSENFSELKDDKLKVEVILETGPESDTDLPDRVSDDSDFEWNKSESNSDINEKTKVRKKITNDVKKGDSDTKKIKTKVNKICPICKKSFRRNYNLQNHMVVHTQEAKHECEVCAKRFTWLKNLKRHSLIHMGEKPHVCTTCGKGFIRKNQLADHEHQHSDEKLTCEFCGKICKTLSTFNKHMKSAHSENADFKEKPTQTPKICDICGKIVSSTNALNLHVKSHGEKEFGCTQCDKKFVSKGLMIAHLRVHTGEKPFSCKECGKKFRTSTCLRRHVLVHTGEKPFPCHLCAKSFRQGQHLQIHLRFHAGIKKFSCEECGKLFLTNDNLTQHKRVHNKNKEELVCEFCTKTFTSWNCMRKHKNTHEEYLAIKKIKKG